MKTFWMVLGNAIPVVRHDTEDKARVEAARLSAQHRGQIFTVLKAVASILTPQPNPQWTSFDDDKQQHEEHHYRCRCPNCEAERPF
jgi:predicted SprT family Zn-dependent metalloprotease